MTAAFAVRYPDRVEMLTDGAFCDADGRLLAVQPKLYTFGTLSMVALGRGFNADFAEFERWATMISNSPAVEVADVLDGLRTMLMVGKLREHRYPYEVIIAAWTANKGPSLYYFGSRPPQETGGIRPYTLVVWEETYLGLGPDPANRLSASDGARLGKQMKHGLAKPALAIFTAMRVQGSAMGPAQRATFWIGGALYLTIIDAKGVRTSGIHQWPDQIGQRIQPAHGRHSQR